MQQTKKKVKKRYISHLFKSYNLMSNNEFLNKYLGEYFINSEFKQLLEEGLYRLRNILWGSPSDLFRNILIETTSICNRKCSYCPVSKYPRKKAFMKKETVRKIIDELAEINYRGKVCFHFFGEPLLDKRLEEFVKYTRDKLPKSKISIYSNGDFLTPELFLNLIKVGTSSFMITMHGTEWSKSMEETIKFVEENPEYKDYLNCITKLHLENRGGLIKIDKVKKRKRCFDPIHAASVVYSGDVVLCCEDYFGNYRYGNVNNEKLMDIWNKEEFKRIRKECAKGIYKLDICKKCVGIKEDF